MKNKIILAVVIIVVGVAGVAAFAYFRSFHKVSVTFSQDVIGATIHKEKGEEVKKLSAAGDVPLQNGNYYIIPDGEKVSKDRIVFTVNNAPLNLSLDPDYSVSFLKDTLTKEQADITAAITDKLSATIKDYTVQDGTLYRHGEWYGAILVPNVADIRNERDFYRILLQKTSEGWSVFKQPELVLTKSEFKDVPITILSAINRLTQ